MPRRNNRSYARVHSQTVPSYRSVWCQAGIVCIKGNAIVPVSAASCARILERLQTLKGARNRGLRNVFERTLAS